MATPSPTDLTAAIIHDPLTIGANSSVMDAIALMSGVRTLCPIDRDHTPEDSLHPEARSSCVVVVDNDQVMGILTERDVVRLIAQQQPLDQLVVGEAMAQPVITRCQADLTDLFSAIDLLQHHHIRHLPIVDKRNRLVGLITHESLRQLTRPVDLLRLRLVQEVMTTDVLYASPDDSMLDIVRLMADRRVSSVVITVPGNSAEPPWQRAVGLLTERDLVQFQSVGLSLKATTAQTVMSSPVFTVAPDTSLWEVQQIMEHRWIRRVVVAGEQGEMLGIITQTSLLQAFNPVQLYQLAEGLEQKVVHLETERFALLQRQAAELEWHITESNQAIRMQAEIDRLLQGFALATTHLMTLQDSHKSVQAALDALGSALRVDRSYIFENHPHPQTGEMALSQRWEWVAEGVTPQVDNPDLQNIPFAETIPSWLQTLSRGQTVAGLVKDFPEEEQAHLLPQGIVSILLVPIFIQDYFWGLVGFDDCHEERVWENSTQSALKAISGTIGSAIARRRAEANATLLAQRLQEAQRIAHVGNWERDLQCNSFYWSEEVFRILEIDSQQFGASYETFLGLVHPDDRALVDEAYASHLQSHHPYSLVHRLHMPDSRIKYVHEQWETTYSAGGTPLISRGTVQDITQQHVAELRRDQAEAALRQVIEGTAAVTGEAFFPVLVRHISEALDVRYVSIDQAMADGFQVLAFFADGELSIPLFLPYDELPCCLKSLQTGSCCHPSGVQALYPGNALFTDLQVDGYLGVRLQNAAGEPIGNLCILHDAPLADPDWAQTLLSIFAARAGAELERLMTAQALEQLNGELESRVAERTAALAEREALLQDFLDNANDLIQMVELDTGRFEFVNHAWQNVLGYTTDDVAQLKCFDVLAPDCHPHCQAMFAQMRSGDVTHLDQVELTFVGKSGQRVVVEGNVNCRFVTEADGSQRPVSTRGIFRDITARKAAEQELQRREARYRALMAGASDAILLANMGGYCIEANQKAADLLGYDRHELVGMHFTQIHPPDTLPTLRKALEALINREHLGTLSLEFLRRDGQRIPVEATASVIDVGGETIAQAIFHDIRDRQQAEQALRESERRYATLAQAVPVAIFRFDLQGHCTYVNERWCDMTGKPIAFAMGDRWLETLHPEDREHSQALIQEWLQAGAVIPFQNEARILRDDGSIVWFYCQMLVETDTNGKQIGYVGTLTDISDRKQAELALQDSETRFRRVFESNVVGMMFTDFSGQVTDANDRFLDIIGYSRADLEAHRINWAQITPPDYVESDQRAIDQLQCYGEILPWEKEYLRLDGRRVSVLIGVALLSERDGRCVCVVVEISDRKRYETALQDSQQLLQTVLDTVPLSVFWKDRHSVIVGCNQAFAAASGFAEPADVIGKNNFDLGFTQAESEGYTTDDCQVITSGIAKLGIEETVTPAGGEQRWIETNKLPLRDGAGNVIGIVGTFQDITDRKQAEQAARQQAQRETVLREITQRIRESLDLQTIFDTACEEIRACLRANRVGIFKFYPDSGYDDGEFAAESVVDGFSSVLTIRVHDHCFGDNYADLYAQGRYQVVDDIYHNGLTTCHSDILAQFQVRANLVMPLLCNNELWGLLCIHQCDGPRHWHQPEIDLGHQLANQLAIAIQQAILYEQLQVELQERQRAEATITQQLRQQTTLELILRQIRQSLDLPEILAIATQQVQELMHSDRVIVFQLCCHGHSRIVEEAVAPDLPRLKALQWEDETWSQDILEHYWQGQPRIVPDVMDDIWTDCLVDYSQTGQIQSKIVAPILQELHTAETHRWVSPESNNKLWGVLVVHACRHRRVWDQEEAQLLQQIANQLAIAIQQASLFEQLQQELTERQQAQQQLTLTNTELVRATRLKDEFLANMSHELRTPLNAILGMTEALQEEDVFGAVNAQQLKALKTVERSGSHLLELINDVLDVAKIEAGQMELNLTPAAIAPLCQSSLAFVKQPALKKRIQLTVNLPADLPTITLDERRIRQVLINLLNNAVKFTPEGGQITLDVTPLAPSMGSEETPYLRFAVTDTGIGISPAEQQRLFQPFVQVDSALNREYQGTGLGLALVKRIVELHKGRVGLTSEVGVGSCFTVDLPYAQGMATILASTPDSSLEAPSSTVATSPATAPLILLAEDNEANISTMVSYLQAKGYRVDIARNGQEALDRLQHLRPDLILMDIQMPGMDGLEAIGHIRRDPSLDQVPVIALTSLAMPGDRDRCLAAGAAEYLSKPVRLKQLVEMIHSLIFSGIHPPPPNP